MTVDGQACDSRCWGSSKVTNEPLKPCSSRACLLAEERQKKAATPGGCAGRGDCAAWAALGCLAGGGENEDCHSVWGGVGAGVTRDGGAATGCSTGHVP